MLHVHLQPAPPPLDVVRVRRRARPRVRPREGEADVAPALGAAAAKHDADGLPAPIKPGVAKFVLATDAVLMSAALLGAVSGPGSLGRAVGSRVFAAGCLVGAVEGAPKTIAALKGLLGAS